MQIPAQLKEDDFISFSSPGAIYSHFNLLPFALLSLQQAVSPQTAGCLYSPCSTEFWRRKKKPPPKKTPKVGAGGRERQQSTGGRSMAVLWHRFLEKMTGFGLLLGKRVRIGQGRCPPSTFRAVAGGDRTSGARVPSSPLDGGCFWLDPAEASSPLGPPGPPALPQFTWSTGITPASGDWAPAPSPSTLKTSSQRAGLGRCPVPWGNRGTASPWSHAPRAPKSGGWGGQSPDTQHRGTPHLSAQQGQRPRAAGVLVVGGIP